MHLKYRGVNDAFRGLVAGMFDGSMPTDVRASRYGEVVVIDEPVIITYSRPRERVLFNAARDCNPFFHIYEALWTLAGRNDVAPLSYYNRRAVDFSDDGETWNDAYGHRWRNGPYLGKGVDYPRGRADQLDILVDHLGRKSESRRAVLQMWNVGDDLLNIDNSKAVCCNLSVLFSVGLGPCRACQGTGVLCMTAGPHGPDDYRPCPTCNGMPHDRPHHLDMTVFNRSNDLIWGALGSNFVVFSFLQEYVAARLGLDVRTYHQVSNNLHAYTNNWRPGEWLAAYTEAGRDKTCNYSRHLDEYGGQKTGMPPLVKDPAVFDRECAEFVERHRRDAIAGEYHEPWLRDVAQPMCVAFHHYKRRDFGRALAVADGIKADDWRVACVAWLRRRADRAAAKEVTSAESK
jgi:thymidylate synthase